MVVQCACICNKSGKILLARMFSLITRHKVNELISSVTRMIEKGTQHTYIEFDTYRFVYLPIEEFYLILICNIQSNIIEDMEILRLFYSMIQDLCKGGLTDTLINDNVFELCLAFDDAIAEGSRESVTGIQIKQYLEMDSNDEKIFNKLQKIKENDAKELAKKKLKEIDLKNKELKKKPTTMSSVSSSDYNKNKSENSPSSQGSIVPLESSQTAKKHFTGKGLVLSGKTGQKEILINVLKKEGENIEIGKAKEKEDVKEVYNPLAEALNIEVSEKISCKLSKDGELENKFEIKGNIYLKINDPEKSNCSIQMKIKNIKGLIMNPHPKLNRELWNTKYCLTPASSKEGFPTNKRLEAIKYKFSSNDSQQLPFSLLAWTSNDAELTSLSIEAKLNSESTLFSKIENLKVIIPCPSPPVVKKIENSEYGYVSSKHVIEWHISSLDENAKSALIDINTEAKEESLFPFEVNLSYENSILGGEVVSIENEKNEKITFATKRLISSDVYLIMHSV